MIKEGDLVQVKNTAPKCCVHRGQIGVVQKVRTSRGLHKTIYIVCFPDSRTSLLREKDLEKIES